MKRFKIKASLDGREIYYWVKVFDTKEQMQAYCKSEDVKASKQEGEYIAEGYCQKWNAIDIVTDVMHPCIGQILMHRGKMGGSILAHEVCHAAWWAYDTLTGRQSIEEIEQEEQLCHLLSDLYNMATNKMYKLEIWRP